MVLVIDTSSVWSAAAVVRDGRAVAEDRWASGRDPELARRVAALARPSSITGVIVALGPGSFTGLRLGVSYGVGLALGLGVPLRGLGSLDIQAARAAAPAIGLTDAGRGRVYWLEPGASPRHGAPDELPTDLPAAGWLREDTARALAAHGVRLLAEDELATFGEASARLSPASRELGYGTVKLEYMHSFGRLR
jgi:tRNA threonylcarbamoyl adenosine modification protein YeaZ